MTWNVWSYIFSEINFLFDWSIDRLIDLANECITVSMYLNYFVLSCSLKELVTLQLQYNKLKQLGKFIYCIDTIIVQVLVINWFPSWFLWFVFFLWTMHVGTVVVLMLILLKPNDLLIKLHLNLFGTKHQTMCNHIQTQTMAHTFQKLVQNNDRFMWICFR